MTLAPPATISITRGVSENWFLKPHESVALHCGRCDRVIQRVRPDDDCEGSIEIERECRHCRLKFLFTIKVDRSESRALQ